MRARRRRSAAFVEQQARSMQAFMLLLVDTCSLSFRVERSIWMLPRSSQFWESDMLRTFTSTSVDRELLYDKGHFHVCV